MSPVRFLAGQLLRLACESGTVLRSSHRPIRAPYEPECTTQWQLYAIVHCYDTIRSTRTEKQPSTCSARGTWAHAHATTACYQRHSSKACLMALALRG